MSLYPFLSAAIILALSACAGDAAVTEPVMQSSSDSTIHVTEKPDSSAAELTFAWNEEGFNTLINQDAYIDDPDKAGPTNIRDAPGGKVIHKLDQDESYIVNIVSQHDGWFELSHVTAFVIDHKISEPPLWIHPSVLSADTRNYNGEKIPVYQYPEENDAYLTNHIETYTVVRFTEFYFDFAHVQCKGVDGTAIDGWILKEWLCGSPVTTCN